ncbi:hypothetical protein CP966_02935 [Streptomyces galilaeus]|nr:hypothetical protein CP966_02935 [Streptomyces galilaeus]GGW59119.1 hypothetical protein GCM10010350_49480 [Streptomyces galilaeus]
MPPRRQPHITDASLVPYRSTACRIGTDHACADSCPVVAPVGLPVVYEVCDCECHSASGLSSLTEVQR